VNSNDKVVAMCLLCGDLIQKLKYHSGQFPKSTQDGTKSNKISQYKILYNVRSSLRFSDFSRHLKVGLWSGENCSSRRVLVYKRKPCRGEIFELCIYRYIGFSHSPNADFCPGTVCA
jgi:hypothetical protein